MRHLSRPLRALLLLCLPFPPAWAAPVFINEFHYDNAGGDVGEFVELAAAGGTDLTGWYLTLYNGATGLAYDRVPLAGLVGDQTGTGYGFVVIGFPANGLQNGAADGLALVDPDGLVSEFLSYEGVLTAADGAALGMTSRDVRVAESGDTPPGASLQRSGRGPGPADMMWRYLLSATPGALNRGQWLGLSAGTLPGGLPWPLWLAALGWLVRRRTCGDNAGTLASPRRCRVRLA